MPSGENRKPLSSHKVSYVALGSEMSVKQDRRMADLSRKRLDRARRLYRFLIVPKLMLGGDDALVDAVAEMKRVGLYAKNTRLGDIVHKLVDVAYRRSESREDPSGSRYLCWEKRHFPSVANVWSPAGWKFRRRLREACA